MAFCTVVPCTVRYCCTVWECILPATSLGALRAGYPGHPHQRQGHPLPAAPRLLLRHRLLLHASDPEPAQQLPHLARLEGLTSPCLVIIRPNSAARHCSAQHCTLKSCKAMCCTVQGSPVPQSTRCLGWPILELWVRIDLYCQRMGLSFPSILHEHHPLLEHHPLRAPAQQTERSLLEEGLL